MKTIKELQEFLGVTPDGQWGPKSQSALDAVLHPITPVAPSIATDGIDSRSAEAIDTLLPQVRPYAQSLVRQCAREGIKIVVTSGTRTYEEQNELYAKHDGTTKARGGYSNHNFGLAFDVTIFNDKTPVWESPKYKIVGAIGKSLGLAWGGDWKSIEDEPHFELRPQWATMLDENSMLAELRRRVNVGQSLF